MSYSTINTWKSIMKTGNHKELINIIHDNATFHSPVVFTPQEGKKKVIKYLSSAVEIFKERNFHYTDNILLIILDFMLNLKLVLIRLK